MKHVKILVSAILAGICIGLGGVAYLSVENKVVGAVLFTVGLFTICTFRLHLFTGKVAYIFQQDKAYARTIPIIWVGNLIGTWLVGFLMQGTRADNIVERAAALCQIKLDDNLLSLFILGIFCNMLIYIAVDNFNNNPHEIGKYLALFLCVVVFVLCGFEHCVADMFYFSIARMWSVDAVVCILVVTLGNVVGGVLFPLTRRWMSKEAKVSVKSK